MPKPPTARASGKSDGKSDGDSKTDANGTQAATTDQLTSADAAKAADPSPVAGVLPVQTPADLGQAIAGSGKAAPAIAAAVVLKPAPSTPPAETDAADAKGKPAAVATQSDADSSATDAKIATKDVAPAHADGKQAAAADDKQAAAPARAHNAEAQPATAAVDHAAAAKPGADTMQPSAIGAPSQHTAPAAAPAPQSGQAAPQAVPLAGVPIEIAAKALAGKNRFDIRLDPPELGRIEVRLDVDRDGRITSHVIADRRDTLDLLQRDASGLQRAFQDAGLKTSDNGLQFSLRDQSAGQEQNSPTTDSARLVVEDDTLPAIETAQTYARLAGSGAGLDIRV